MPQFQRRHDIGYGFGVAAFAAVIHSSILRLQWLFDDAFNIHFLQTHDLRFLFVPKLWRELPFQMYTPMLFVSQAFDLRLFGVAPRPWYAHHLLSFVAASVILFVLLRHRLPPLESAAGAALFVINPYILGWSGLLMVRHYIEGFAFASAALIFSILYLRRKRRHLLAGAAITYAFAILSKELFVLLAAVVPFLPEQSRRDRARLTAALGAVALWYAVIRYVMIGTWVGGYGWAIPPDARWSFYATAPFRISAAALKPALFWIPVVASCLFLAFNRRHVLWPLLVAFAAVVLPVVVVSTELEPRYLVLPSLVGAAAVLAACLAFPRPKRLYLLGVLGAWAVTAGVVGNRPLLNAYRRQSAESRFFLQLGPQDVLAYPSIAPADIAQLNWLKESLHRPSGTSWFFDDIYACTHDLANKNVWKHAGSRFVVFRGPSRETLPCDGAKGHPLSVDMRHEGDAMYWRLGPYERGTYAIVMGEGTQAFAVPRHWGFHLGTLPGISFRVRYSSPEGWVTYSPLLSFEFAKKRLVWSSPPH